jgi:hypothetical protein
MHLKNIKIESFFGFLLNPKINALKDARSRSREFGSRQGVLFAMLLSWLRTPK